MVATLARVPASSADRGDNYDAGQALELVQEVRRPFRARDELYAYIWDVIYGRVSTNIPKGYRKIGRARRNPLAVYYTNTITAALTVNPPAVQFPVAGLGVAAETNASLREHFFDASWIRQEEAAEVPIWRRFTHSVVCLGEGVLKTVPRSRTAWADYAKYSRDLSTRLAEGDLKKLDRDSKDRLYDARTEEYKRTIAPYPIKSIDVQPETFYCHRGEDGITLAVEHKRVPYLEALVRNKMALARGGRVVPEAAGEALPPENWRSEMEGTTALTLSEVWEWDRCRYLMAGPGQVADRQASVARAFRHRYGDPVTRSLRGPYAHCYGTTTASRLPENAGLGVLFGFLDLFVMLDELLTIQQINAVITGLASFKRNQPPAGSQLPEAQYGEDGLPLAREAETIEPGKIFPYDIGPIEMPRAGVALGDTIGQTREFIELILPKVLQGVVDTTDSGYQLALAARLGRIAFDPMVSNMRRAGARRVGFESWLIEHEIGETVYAQGEPVKKPGQRKSPKGGVLGIGPDDLKGIHEGYKIRLEPEDKATELINIRAGAEAVQNRFKSRSQVIEEQGGNPEEVELEILLEETKDDPEIKAFVKQRVMQKVGAAEARIQAQADQALAQVAPMPQPGSALQGMGNAFEGGQNLPIAPGGPGEVAVPAQAPGAPGSIPLQPPGVAPMQQQVNPNPATSGLGVLP